MLKSVIFFQPSFNCCFHIIISSGIPDVASALETEAAASGKP
jgi:hypothetical protein